jgi:hypothetical protein
MPHIRSECGAAGKNPAQTPESGCAEMAENFKSQISKSQIANHKHLKSEISNLK